MARELVSDELWAVVAPLLPPRPPRPKGGRPPIPDRQALRGILFVLRTGLPWEYLPAEMGCGSGMSCWRRLRDWQAAGVWSRLHHVLLDRLGAAGRIDWSRASLDAAAVPAQKGGGRREQIPPTAANSARSITSLWNAAGFRAPRSSVRPTRTTR